MTSLPDISRVSISSNESSSPSGRLGVRSRPVHMQTESYLRLLATKRQNPSPLPQLEPASRISGRSTPALLELDEPDESRTPSRHGSPVRGPQDTESLAAESESERLEFATVESLSPSFTPGEFQVDNVHSSSFSDSHASVLKYGTHGKNDKEVQDLIDDIRRTLTNLKNNSEQFSRDRRRTSDVSIYSMVLMDEKSSDIEKSTRSFQSERIQPQQKKKSNDIETTLLDFFTPSNKIPKALLDAAKKRNQALEQQVYRQQISFQRFQDIQDVLLNTLLAKQEKLDKLIKRVDSDLHLGTSDSGMEDTSGDTKTLNNFNTDSHNNPCRFDGHRMPQSAKKDQASQTSGSSVKEEAVTQHRTKNVLPKRSVSVEVHNPPPSGHETTGMLEDPDRFDILLRLIQTTLRENRDELRAVLNKSQDDTRDEMRQLVSLVEGLVQQHGHKTETKTDMKDILHKLKVIEQSGERTVDRT
ncbi:hypothetical protein BV898_17657 [Hypsibius exemplaris]|uniref:Uncharacterized protein n=1 Tax=Hypsibius exemplaris TaxID=2072580 RepID=A0A9X6RMD1_HYPEX|nr:hypothetical protein BV898_17657 [Hypsibius exemplaris]